MSLITADAPLSMPRARHRSVTSTSHVGPSCRSIHRSRSCQTLDGHLVSASTRFLLESHVIATPAASQWTSKNAFPVRRQSACDSSPLALAFRGFQANGCPSRGRLFVCRRESGRSPHTVLPAAAHGLLRARLKPPSGRSSRKSVPPEGLPQFSACPVAGARSAGSAPSCGGFIRGAIRPRWARPETRREGDHHV